MSSIDYIELPTSNHWVNHNLQAYIYKDMLPVKDFTNLKNLVAKYYEKPNHNSYLIHGATIHTNKQKIKLVSTDASKRYQEIPFDWSYHSQWIKQTPDTIKEWSNKQLYSGQVDAPFIKFVKSAENFAPFNKEPNKWICFRLHLNILKNTNVLSLHRDSGGPVFNKLQEKVRYWGLTYYLWDHVEGEGGEFFTQDGWVYKPKQNSAICINGHLTLHGVTANMSSINKPRLAFTTRWLHADDINFETSENTVTFDYDAYDKID